MRIHRHPDATPPPTPDVPASGSPGNEAPDHVPPPVVDASDTHVETPAPSLGAMLVEHTRGPVGETPKFSDSENAPPAEAAPVEVPDAGAPGPQMENFQIGGKTFTFEAGSEAALAMAASEGQNRAFQGATDKQLAEMNGRLARQEGVESERSKAAEVATAAASAPAPFDVEGMIRSVDDVSAEMGEVFRTLVKYMDHREASLAAEVKKEHESGMGAVVRDYRGRLDEVGGRIAEHGPAMNQRAVEMEAESFLAGKRFGDAITRDELLRVYKATAEVAVDPRMMGDGVWSGEKVFSAEGRSMLMTQAWSVLLEDRLRKGGAAASAESTAGNGGGTVVNGTVVPVPVARTTVAGAGGPEVRIPGAGRARSEEAGDSVIKSLGKLYG